VVVCAGVRSRDFAAQLGDRVNIYPVKGYSITVNMKDEASQRAAPWISLLDDKAKIVTSRLGPDRFRIAGTAEFNGYNYDIRQDRIDPLIRWCEDNFPDLSTVSVTPWAGLRPMMPSMVPRVGAGAQPGVFYNTGHGRLGWSAARVPCLSFHSPCRDYCFRHLGWTLSAATAEMVAEAVLAQERAGHKGRFFSFASNADSGAQKGVHFEGAGLDGVWRKIRQD